MTDQRSIDLCAKLTICTDLTTRMNFKRWLGGELKFLSKC